MSDPYSTTPKRYCLHTIAITEVPDFACIWSVPRPFVDLPGDRAFSPRRPWSNGRRERIHDSAWELRSEISASTLCWLLACNFEPFRMTPSFYHHIACCSIDAHVVCAQVFALLMLDCLSNTCGNVVIHCLSNTCCNGADNTILLTQTIHYNTIQYCWRRQTRSFTS